MAEQNGLALAETESFSSDQVLGDGQSEEQGAQVAGAPDQGQDVQGVGESGGTDGGGDADTGDEQSGGDPKKTDASSGGERKAAKSGATSKRFKELHREKRESVLRAERAERENEELRAKLREVGRESDPKPNIRDFDDGDKFMKARQEWEQRNGNQNRTAVETPNDEALALRASEGWRDRFGTHLYNPLLAAAKGSVFPPHAVLAMDEQEDVRGTIERVTADAELMKALVSTRSLDEASSLLESHGSGGRRAQGGNVNRSQGYENPETGDSSGLDGIMTVRNGSLEKFTAEQLEEPY